MRKVGLFMMVMMVWLGLQAPAGWAWPVPDTGQTTSYLAGDDGSYTIHPRSYTVNDNGTVTDNVTTLVWQRQDDGQARNWDAANGYCETLTLGGFSDWRLPTPQELASLVNFGGYSPAIDTTTFPGVKSSGYWSSTTYAGPGSYAWDVDFHYGYVDYGNKASSNYVRCLRSGTGELVI